MGLGQSSGCDSSAGQTEPEDLFLTVEDLEAAYKLGVAYAARALATSLSPDADADLSSLAATLTDEEVLSMPGRAESVTFEWLVEYVTGQAAALREVRLQSEARESALPLLAISDESAHQKQRSEWQAAFRRGVEATTKLVAGEQSQGRPLSSLLEAARDIGPISTQPLNTPAVDVSALYSVILVAIKTDLEKLGVQFSTGIAQASNVKADVNHADLVLAGLVACRYISGDQSTAPRGDMMKIGAARTSLRKSVRGD
eukprot:TRINITY_DN33741_c0_g1_i1.p1 TRINITY_DN33741_c0_g1~~TRINITY_DN33741_c0_g1_i1.p1  ORF type:complete len:257 (-),score=49.39 TRINITY_DN33741_c0_g1_i1:428-1198(-)